jgi:hypothetical protein
MNNFVKENWYKLMVGSSMMMASFGFMIYAVSPSYANKDITEEKIVNNSKSPDENYFDFFLIDSQDRVWSHKSGDNHDVWTKTNNVMR